MTAERTILEAVSLAVGHGRDPDVVRGVDLAIRERRVLCIVGPNGAGKSTLLAALAGIIAPRSGSVVLLGRDISDLPPIERARVMGYLPQHVEPALPYTVREIVALGRFPHGRGLGFETEADRAATERAMEAAGVRALAARPFREISGGERQRVLVASVLAGEPQALLLDEPTSALDIGQAGRLMSLLVSLARAGAAVVVVTHDLNLAGAFADEVALVARGGLRSLGAPRDVLSRDLLEEAYGPGFALVERPGGAVPAIVPDGPEVGA